MVEKYYTKQWRKHYHKNPQHERNRSKDKYYADLEYAHRKICSWYKRNSVYACQRVKEYQQLKKEGIPTSFKVFDGVLNRVHIVKVIILN